MKHNWSRFDIGIYILWGRLSDMGFGHLMTGVEKMGYGRYKGFT